MCKPLGVPLVLSGSIARHLEPASVHPLGRHGLRGVSAERPLFTLETFAPGR